MHINNNYNYTVLSGTRACQDRTRGTRSSWSSPPEARLHGVMHVWPMTASSESERLPSTLSRELRQICGKVSESLAQAALLSCGNDDRRKSRMAGPCNVLLLFALLVCGWTVDAEPTSPNYLIGRGMFDMTGPAAEINMVRLQVDQVAWQVLVSYNNIIILLQWSERWEKFGDALLPKFSCHF